MVLTTWAQITTNKPLLAAVIMAIVIGGLGFFSLIASLVVCWWYRRLRLLDPLSTTLATVLEKNRKAWNWHRLDRQFNRFQGWYKSFKTPPKPVTLSSSATVKAQLRWFSPERFVALGNQTLGVNVNPWLMNHPSPMSINYLLIATASLWTFKYHLVWKLGIYIWRILGLLALVVCLYGLISAQVHPDQSFGEWGHGLIAQGYFAVLLTASTVVFLIGEAIYLSVQYHRSWQYWTSAWNERLKKAALILYYLSVAWRLLLHLVYLLGYTGYKGLWSLSYAK